MEPHLGTYNEIPGVEGPRQGPMVGSVTAMIKAMSNYDVCSAAGDHGCVMAWRDDDGKLHADFQRYQQQIAAGDFRSRAALRRWLKEWLPKIYVAD